MPEKEAALNAVRRLIHALNAGDNDECLAGMTRNAVIVDDVAPFQRSGRKGAEKWLARLADTREQLLATVRLEDSEVRVAGKRAYVVAPGILRGSLVASDFEINALVTATLIERGGKWLVDTLTWSSLATSQSEFASDRHDLR